MLLLMAGIYGGISETRLLCFCTAVRVTGTQVGRDSARRAATNVMMLHVNL